MLLRSARRLSLLLLLAIVSSWLPAAAYAAPPASPLATSASLSVPAEEIVPPPPETRTLQPVRYPALPGLALALTVAPDPLAVGDTATISVTITNRADAPAEDLTLTLPTPDGASALSGTGRVSPEAGWRFSLGHLDGQASLVVTGTLRLERMPAGDALLATAQATARGLTQPVTITRGALAFDPALGAATTPFVPGSSARLRSRDGRVDVLFPARAASRALTLRHARTPLASTRTPPPLVRGHSGMGAFFLDATDTLSSTVHQFSQPLTITVSYTPEQLQAHGLSQAGLTLFWYDDAQAQWVPLPTQVDSSARTASAQVDHFTPFQLSDGSSPSSAFIPSLQGFQVGLYTGAANYNVPLEAPAGPGGIKPALALSYSSAASDGPGGERAAWQAPWTGKGWALDAGGYVALNKSIPGDSWNNYTFVFGGLSFDIVKGTLLPPYTDYYDTDPTHWTWHAIDENFARVRASYSGADLIWQAWTKDGTRYDFTQSLWTSDSQESYVYKWLLMRVTDTHHNSIVYDYQVDTINFGGPLYQPTSYLRAIYWGYDGADATGTPRYKVSFNAASRWAAPTAGVDTNWEYPLSSVSTHWQPVAPHEAYRLDSIAVLSWPSGASDYQLVRQYNLTYAASDQSMQTDDYDGQKVLTLQSVTRVGKDGTSVLPSTSFSYGMDRGAVGNTRPAGFNRLLTVLNGQGGQISFTYEHPWASSGAIPSGACWCNYRNYHRVTQALRQDISGKRYSSSALTTYSYVSPSLNDEAHAATVLYAHYPPSGNGDSTLYLARQDQREFRGHASVTEQTYDGATTAAPLLQTVQHWFYQGDAGCSVPVTSGKISDTDPCFVAMRDRESWKGREYQTEVRANSGAVLSRTNHTFVRVALPFFGSDPSNATQSNNYQRVGIWRAFVYESQTVQSTLEGNASGINKTTQYFYNTSCTADTASTVTASYGNLGCITEYDASGALVRKTLRYYTMTDTPGGTYLTDRMWGETILDGSGNLLAVTHQFYDNLTTPTQAPTIGELRRVSRFYDVPASCCPNPIHSSDTTYSYDSYGNRTSETSYASAGSYTASSNTWSAAGSGSAARTTTTTYDSTFHAFPTQVTRPLVNTPLSQSATYDYQMGTLTSVTDENSQVTSATYDKFGRMLTLVKPGDSSSYPTLTIGYYDWETPFRYLVWQRIDALTTNARAMQTLYDGLGRQVQVKRQGPSGWQNIVTDTRSDALGRTVAQSQPRSNSEDATLFWQYIDPGTTLNNPTSTTYDALGRPIRVTAADGNFSEHQYGITGTLTYDDLVDANRHRSQSRADTLGRLTQVVEIAGNCGTATYSWASCAGSYTVPWTTAATTNYSYCALDLLRQVTDAVGNVTTIGYDSLGRKTSQADPDMGSWTYQYDANGNLTSQSDAKGQTIAFVYDALGRLTRKSYPGNQAAVYYYDEAGVPNGKGRRTAMATNNSSGMQTYERWEYDARGRTTLAGQSAQGVTQDLVYSYDSADQLKTTRYSEAGETISYSYDVSGRPSSLCSSLGGCYVSSASYSALDQPLSRTLGNSEIQTWVYKNPMQRLWSMQLGPSGALSSQINRWYAYDAGGNVSHIDDYVASQNQYFGYDERDRLTSAYTTGSASGAYNESYSYNLVGNLLSKAGVAYTYPAAGSARPHTPSSVGGQTYSYDANGNLLSGGGRTLTWTAENLIASVTSGGSTESYTYDADGERVAKTVGGATTVYFAGIWEQTVGGASKRYYTFNGEVVAMRDSSTNAVTYLHGDHLGSVSVATNSSGATVSQQQYDPWGKLRTGGVGQTTLNYTGQRLDGTGLLYYHARYYDPNLGRFLSADSVVPGAGALTVAPSDATAAALFAQGAKDKNGKPTAPLNPQTLNRYSYVENNPLRYTDPNGHCIFAIVDTIACAAVVVEVAEVAFIAVAGVLVVHTAATVGTELGRAHAATADQGKPLTPDEQKLIDRVGSVPKFLDDHPDLEEEAKVVNNGGTLEKGRDHVGEAKQRVNMLDKAIRHLQGVRDARDAEAQAAIDKALEQAREYRERLQEILNAK